VEWRTINQFLKSFFSLTGWAANPTRVTSLTATRVCNPTLQPPPLSLPAPHIEGGGGLFPQSLPARYPTPVCHCTGKIPGLPAMPTFGQAHLGHLPSLCYPGSPVGACRVASVLLWPATCSTHRCTACHCCRAARAELLADNVPAALDASVAFCMCRLGSSGRLVAHGPPAMLLRQANGDKSLARAAPSMSAARRIWLLTPPAARLTHPCLLHHARVSDESAARSPQNSLALVYKNGRA
jgi:hypothetical protein